MDNETKEEIIYKRVKAIDRLPLHYASVLFVVEGVYNYSGYYDYSLKKFLRNVGDRGFEAKDVEWLEPANASLQYAELKKEVERLTYWKESEIELWSPLIDWFQANRNVKPGTLISEEALRRSQEYERLQAENESLKKVLIESSETIQHLVSEYANGTSMAAEETLTAIKNVLDPTS